MMNVSCRFKTGGMRKAQKTQFFFKKARVSCLNSVRVGLRNKRTVYLRHNEGLCSTVSFTISIIRGKKYVVKTQHIPQTRQGKQRVDNEESKNKTKTIKQ